jgi:hypothetical protein
MIFFLVNYFFSLYEDLNEFFDNDVEDYLLIHSSIIIHCSKYIK